MILSIGEILTDMIGDNDIYKMYIGGAPFNVAVNARRGGADVTFIGKVGKDVAGDFIIREIKKYNLNDKIKVDLERNTTMAFVSRINGERSFAFVRHDTSDYQLEYRDIEGLESADVVHLGTLMLSEQKGRAFADECIKAVKSANKLLSMDANLRDDLFKDKDARNRIMLSYLMTADILKLSMDELYELTNTDDLTSAIDKMNYGGLLFITDGANGSYAVMNNLVYFARCNKVKPIDTTGAGDAFYGAVLAEIDKCINQKLDIQSRLPEILNLANEAGARAVLHEGAV